MQQNLVMPAGLQIIDAAKQNGSWTQLDNVENFVIPAELGNFLARNKSVAEYFAGLSKSRRKLWLYRMYCAKLPETKKKRLAELMAEANCK